MPVTIRPATPADAPAIAHVQVASWRTTYRMIVPETFFHELTIPSQTEKWTQWLALPNLHTFVAESGPDVLGFVSGGPIREPLPGFDVELYALYLLKPWQRQGIGRRLVRTLSAALIEHNHQGLLLWVLEANPSVQFYRRLGGVAQHRKFITLGDIDLPEISFAWPNLATLAQT